MNLSDWDRLLSAPPFPYKFRDNIKSKYDL